MTFGSQNIDLFIETEEVHIYIFHKVSSVMVFGGRTRSVFGF